MKKRLLVFLLATVLMMSLAYGAFASSYPLTVIDTAGNEVVIESEPKTVVSLAASNTEILYALGLGELVTGVDAYSDYPAEALKDHEVIGDYNGPNVERILALAPDVVFAGNALQKEAMDALKGVGITVVAVEATEYEKIAQSISLVADVMNVSAEAVLNAMEEKAEEALALAEQCKDKTVYYALSFGEYGDWSAGDGSFVSAMISKLGAINIADGLGYAWPMYSSEQLLEKDPDIILVSGGDAAADSFRAFPAYQELTAVKNGHVYGVDANTSARPGPRINEALLEFAEKIAQ